jgi:glycosyltransferase involved in cell wall biosynthesis
MNVSLVIPGRNVSGTIKECSESVVPLLNRHGLEEIIFVDDGSVDATAEIVQRYPVRYIRTEAKGPGAARNTGWQSAKGDLIWFVDADCIAEPDALSILLEHMKDPQLAGVGGSYGNAREDSLLACLVHEEIVERHLRMPSRVNFLASFNVLYRREVLERFGGFDETYLKAQDAELAYRIQQTGAQLAFDPSSRVKHHHPVKFLSYLRTQSAQAYWRMFLYARHPGKMRGDSYSSLIDHIQPILGVLTLATLLFSLFASLLWASSLAAILLAFTQIPMTSRLVRRCGTPYVLFAPMSFTRSFARGIGMMAGIFSAFLAGLMRFFGRNLAQRKER